MNNNPKIYYTITIKQQICFNDDYFALILGACKINDQQIFNIGLNSTGLFLYDDIEIPLFFISIDRFDGTLVFEVIEMDILNVLLFGDALVNSFKSIYHTDYKKFYFDIKIVNIDNTEIYSYYQKGYE